MLQRAKRSSRRPTRVGASAAEAVEAAEGMVAEDGGRARRSASRQLPVRFRLDLTPEEMQRRATLRAVEREAREREESDGDGDEDEDDEGEKEGDDEGYNEGDKEGDEQKDDDMASVEGCDALPTSSGPPAHPPAADAASLPAAAAA